MRVEKDLSETEALFENRSFPCFSIRCFAQQGTVKVYRNKKVLETFIRSSFPDHLDFNDTSTFSTLIEVVRKGGIEALQQQYNLEIRKPNKK